MAFSGIRLLSLGAPARRRLERAPSTAIPCGWAGALPPRRGSSNPDRGSVPTRKAWRRDLAGADRDAAINPGNSGGPVVQGSLSSWASPSRCSGRAVNIGFFFDPRRPSSATSSTDLSDGSYEGFPARRWCFRPSSPAPRRELRLPAERSGAVVEAIPKGAVSRSARPRRRAPRAIDGERISDDGTFGAGLTFQRLALSHLFDMKLVGQTVPPCGSGRDGQVVDVRWRAGRYPVLDRMRSARMRPASRMEARSFVPVSARIVERRESPRRERMRGGPSRRVLPDVGSR